MEMAIDKKSSHPKRPYRVEARQLKWAEVIEARNVEKAVNAACRMLASELPESYTSAHPLTVRCVDGDGNVLFAKNLFHRRPDGVVRSRRTAGFRVER